MFIPVWLIGTIIFIIGIIIICVTSESGDYPDIRAMFFFLMWVVAYLIFWIIIK